MKKTVKDIYEQALTMQLPLLSNYASTFWAEYLANHERYDSLFRRLYKSYRFYDQEADDTISEVTMNFINAVYEHLLVNDKKYTELYRMYVISDDKYSITDNYNMVETMDRETSNAGTNTSGSRTDSGTNSTGAQTNESTAKVAPYDSDTFHNSNSVNEAFGARSDSNSYSKGEQVDNVVGSSEEAYTLTRKGNIGVQTGTDMLDKHQTLWSRYEFYAYIFREICADLLLV